MFFGNFFGPIFGGGTQIGSEEGDLLEGSIFDETLDGRGGDDTIEGNAGDDRMLGGDGDDLMDGGSGEDTMEGGNGGDTMEGGRGDDLMVGNKGNDFVFGEDGDDLMVWDNGDGSDLFDGGEGDDTVQVNFNTDLEEDDLQNDDTATIGTGEHGVEFARTELNGQTERGLFQLDIRETETLETNFGGGDDTAKFEDDVIDEIELDLDGGEGTDLLDLSKTSSSVEVNLHERRLGSGHVTGFENVIGTEFDDMITGDNQANVISGLGGVDEIYGKDGGDTIIAGKGNDFVFAGGDDDLMVWNNGDGSDLFDGGSSDDTVQVNFNTDLVNDDLQNDDTATFGTGANGVEFARTELNGQSQFGLFQLDIRESEFLETNFGGGNDTAVITGDVLEEIELILDGGDGTDTLDFSQFAEGIEVDLQDETVGSAIVTNFENVIGTEFNDIIIGNDEDNVISGLGGADTLDGGAGGDVFLLRTDGEADLIEGGLGRDFVHLGGVFADAPSIVADALALPPGTLVVNGALSEDLDAREISDVYSFTLTETTTLTIDYQSGPLDPVLFLMNEAGQVLVADDDSGPSTNSRITTTLAPGTYSVGLAEFGGGAFESEEDFLAGNPFVAPFIAPEVFDPPTEQTAFLIGTDDGPFSDDEFGEYTLTFSVPVSGGGTGITVNESALEANVLLDTFTDAGDGLVVNISDIGTTAAVDPLLLAFTADGEDDADEVLTFEFLIDGKTVTEVIEIGSVANATEVLEIAVAVADALENRGYAVIDNGDGTVSINAGPDGSPVRLNDVTVSGTTEPDFETLVGLGAASDQGAGLSFDLRAATMTDVTKLNLNGASVIVAPDTLSPDVTISGDFGGVGTVTLAALEAGTVVENTIEAANLDASSFTLAGSITVNGDLNLTESVDDTLIGNDDGFGETFNAGAGDDTVSGRGGDDVINGGDGDDLLVGGKGDDQVFGGAGDDLMVWNNGDGSDLLDGGADDDRVQVNFNTDLVNDDLQNDDTARIEDSAEGVAFARTEVNGQSQFGLFQLDIRNTETLETNFGAGNDTAELVGNVVDAIAINLDGGDDTTDTTPADLATGDTLNLSELGQGARVDLDVLNQGVLQGPSDGSDATREGLSESGRIFVGANSVEATDFENVIGTEFNDTIFGNAQNNVLQGGAGNDVLHPFAGDDFVDGGEGIDTLLLNGFAKGSLVDMQTGISVFLDGSPGENRFANIENVNGSSVAGDEISGDDGANTLNGLGGNDLLIGGGGNDLLIGGDNIDRARAAAEGDNADTLDGGIGDDVLIGGLGVDQLTGGAGQDAFFFNADSGGDLILDFSAADDRFVLDVESFGVGDADTEPLVQSVARDGDGTDAGLIDVLEGQNVYILQGGFENAGAAADALAEALAGGVDDGAGFFVYFNVNQERVRLISSEDLDDVDSDIALVANLTEGLGSDPDALDTLGALGAENFDFASIVELLI